MTEAACVTSVFLLAENRLLREALARILRKKNDIEVVGAAPCSPAILAAIEAASPQVVLFDPLDARSGIAFLQTLRETMPRVKVVMIGMELDPELFVLAVREGIVAYLLMEATAAEIVAALRSVMAGGAVCPPELCSALFRHVAAQRPRLPSFAIKTQFGLTSREQQLVEMAGRSLTNKEIALELGLSEQTIKNHMHRMLRKVGVRDRLQAVEVCRSQGAIAI